MGGYKGRENVAAVGQKALLLPSSSPPPPPHHHHILTYPPLPLLSSQCSPQLPSPSLTLAFMTNSPTNCMNPLDHLRLANLNEDVARFQANLSLGLQKLEESHARSFISVEWAQEAVDLLRSSHASVVTLVEKFQLLLTAGKHEEIVNAYMDETVNLMDVCGALRKGVARLEFCERLVDEFLVISRQGACRVAEHRRLHVARLIAALDAWKEGVTTMLRENAALVLTTFEAKGRFCMNISDGHVGDCYARWSGFWGVIYPMKSVICFLSKILVWGLLYLDRVHSFHLATVYSESPWALSISALQQSIVKQINLRVSQGREDNILLEEFAKQNVILEVLFTDLQEVFDRGEPLLLRLTFDVLKRGLETLDWHINDLYDDIIEGRRKLLATLHQPSISSSP